MKKYLFHILPVIITICFMSCEKDYQTSNDESYSNEFAVIQEEALTIANKLLSKNDDALKSKMNYNISEMKGDNGEVLIYLLNFEDGGFVLVSGDKRTKPIIAFSKSNYFITDKNELPPNLKYWLNGAKRVIENVKKSNKKQSPEIQYLWDVYYSKAIDPEEPCDITYKDGPLMETKWSQGCGYNIAFPTEASIGCTGLPCDRAFTGCTNTAMAQIMKYHEYPTSYSWSSMPNKTPATATSELMYDIAESTNSNYACNGTYTTTSIIVPAFENDFGYSSSAVQVTYYPSSGYNTIKSEITNDRPVLFTGYDPVEQAGHAWVCDGYKTDYYCLIDLWEYKLSMNWGWYNGSCNGYYAYDDFDPSIYEFTNSRKFVKGIKP